jgi:hypothetical protein
MRTELSRNRGGESTITTPDLLGATDTSPIPENSEQTMYDMYPDWGPARHREPLDTLTREHARDPHLQMLQDALDQRDETAERPDDN